MSFVARTDFIGPLPTGSHWSFTVAPVGNEGLHVFSMTKHTQDPIVLTTIRSRDGWAITDAHVDWPEASNMSLFATLQDGSNVVIDQGQVAVPWTTARGLQQQITDEGSTTGGGLTPAEAQQVDETHQSTWPEVLVDNLGVQLLPGDPASGYVAVDLTRPVFGIIVRMTEIPADLVAETPDGDYWYTSLAVVRIYRGADLWIRAPIHITSERL